MKIAIYNGSGHFDHTVLAEVISRRWREDRPFFTVSRKTRGVPLKASWWRRAADGALELHWSRGRPVLPGEERPLPLQAKFPEGAA